VVDLPDLKFVVVLENGTRIRTVRREEEEVGALSLRLLQIQGSDTYPSHCQGGLGWLNNIPVVQGTNYTVVVGSGGNKGTLASYPANIAGTAGGHSYFESIAMVAGCGGSPGSGGGFVPAGSGGAGGGALTPPSPSPPSRRLEARLPSSFPSSGGGGAGGGSLQVKAISPRC